MANQIANKIERLLQIFCIPIEEQWEEYVGENIYSVYQYWNVLGLIDDESLKQINNFEVKPKSSVPMQNYFKGLDFHFSPAYYTNQLVADVGSGFGFITFWLIISGAEIVYSIGDPERIEFINKLYKIAVEKNLLPAHKLRLKPSFVKVGDDTLFEDLENDSLSLILLNDTLEHITPRIFPSLVHASYNNLKKGGKFISRQQNTDSPTMLNKLKIVWENAERNCLLQQRIDLINEYMKDIDGDDCQRLAKATRGLDSIDFYAALDNYSINKSFPKHDTLIPPIDLKLDVPEEGDTSIQRICAEFKRKGFRKIEVYPDLMSSRRSRYFQMLAQSFPKMFFDFEIFDDTSVFKMTK